jgi:hypothetical protein
LTLSRLQKHLIIISSMSLGVKGEGCTIISEVNTLQQIMSFSLSFFIEFSIKTNTRHIWTQSTNTNQLQQLIVNKWIILMWLKFIMFIWLKYVTCPFWLTCWFTWQYISFKIKILKYFQKLKLFQHVIIMHEFLILS